MPPGAVIVIGPGVALAGTVVVIDVVPLRVQPETSTPWNLTADIAIRPVPVITTVAPAAPDVGVNEEIVGALYVKVGPVAVPVGVVTVTGPEVAMFGTVATIEVAELTV